MKNKSHATHPLYSLMHTDIDGVEQLAELALDMRWSWSHGADEMWRQIDPELWDKTYNPWAVLQTVSREKLENILANKTFRNQVNELINIKHLDLESPAWFQQKHNNSKLNCVAYFCMEFMLSEALPIYSGGLGNVAGDQLKAASDLGIPIIGIGLLYQQGYFRQEIDNNGMQHEHSPFNDPGQLPITPLRHANGDWMRLEVLLPGYSIWLRAWQVQVGKVKLYLLDSNDLANLPVHRGITSELYGGGTEMRIKQEMILGLGGWRLLRAMDLKPEVCHLNEGHAAFAVLERARNFMEENKVTFEIALAITRAGNLFTTHTAVPAGFDLFSPELIEHYLKNYAENKLGISLHDLLALGRINPNDDNEKFNMAYLAMRGSGAVNGVSRLHGKVSQHLFEPLFSRLPTDEVPVTFVTNGVHMPSWDSAAADDLWTDTCGKERWRGSSEKLEEDILNISDSKLWKFRIKANIPLIDFVRKRLSRHYAAANASTEIIEEAKLIFKPNVFTLGFARRFASYKRPNLLLHNPERLFRILTNNQFPVQLVIAGKAHPADEEGKALIKQWVNFIRQPEVRPHAIFISDYDMQITEFMVQGVDVWLNTPRRPWEACGTSGMKVLVNGGINLSELDGWWAEAYTPEVGWALGDGKEHGDDPDWDAYEANQLYDLLEQHVIPEFYNRNEKGIPTAWVAKIRESMAKLTPLFSANRTVCEYTDKHYLPAAENYLERVANFKSGTNLIDEMHAIANNWNSMHFGELTFKTTENSYQFQVEVNFYNLNPDAVKIQLYCNGVNGEAPFIQEMTRGDKLFDSSNTFTFYTMVTSIHSPSDYTARAIPNLPSVSVPLEFHQILWQR